MSTKREQALEGGIKRLEAMSDAIRRTDAPAAQAAKERAETRKAKYGEKPTPVRRILVVPKGSVPWRGLWSAYFAEMDAKSESEAKSDGGEV